MNAVIKVVVLLASSASAAAVKAEVAEEVSLAKAVAEFNEKMGGHSADGVARPPLTEDEVVAAIRAINRKQLRMDDWTYADFQKIAKTRQLPGTAQLSCLTQAVSGDYEIVMWRIDLEINLDSKHGYSYPLRTHYITSAPISSHTDRIYKVGQ